MLINSNRDGAKGRSNNDNCEDETVAAMWSELGVAGFRFSLGTKNNPIASRWARHIKNKANSDCKAIHRNKKLS